MKKILLLMVLTAFVFTGCKKDDKKDDERTSQTILLHLKDSDQGLITVNPKNTAVFFFEDNGKAVNYLESNPSLDDGKLTYTDGTLSSEAKIVGSGKVVYTFENVSNGKYILWVHYFPYSKGTHSSKQLVVTEDSHLKIEEKIFKSGSASYQEW